MQTDRRVIAGRPVVRKYTAAITARDGGFFRSTDLPGKIRQKPPEPVRHHDAVRHRHCDIVGRTKTGRAV